MDVFDKVAEPILPGHVDDVVDEIACGAPDVVLVNPCSQRTNYPSKVWQTFWDGYSEGDRDFFGSLPETTLTRRDHLIRQMARLAEQCDYLATALARCRHHGMKPGISMRMNDMHDIPWPDSHLFSRFYKDNPQYHLRPIYARDWGAQALNYEHAAVREHYLSLIREWVDGYDFDVFELDFSRFTYYFERGNADQHCAIMTAFISDVRECLAGADRSITLIARIAADPDAAYQLGFDVETWGREKLLDGIVATSQIRSCWTMPIDKFRQACGPELAIYAGAEVIADKRDGVPVRYLPTSCELLRGFAVGYLAAGADGIELFNFFLRRRAVADAETFYGPLREMRSLADIRGKPRVHLLGTGYWTAEFDLPDQVPVTIGKHAARSFHMLLAAAAGDAAVSVQVCFDGDNAATDLWLRIGRFSGHADELLPGPEGDPNDLGRDWLYDYERGPSCRQSKIARFNIPSSVIQDGRNELVLRSENVSTTILGIDVAIGC